MQNMPALVIGLILIALGTLFLFDNLGYVYAWDVVSDYWPLLIIITGLLMLIRGKRSQVAVISEASPGAARGREGSSIGVMDSSNFISQSEVFGDIKLDITSKSFSGGSCNTVFGDIRLDLSTTELAQGEHYLRLSTVFGDVKLDVPKDMEFSVQVSSFIGEVKIKGSKRSGFLQSHAFQTPGFTSANRKLLVIISQVFGDTKIY